MGTHRERFLHNLATFEALLRGEARVHSYHCVPSSLSLFTQDVEKRAPGGIHNALGKMMVLHHSGNLKVFYSYAVIAFSIGFSCLVMMVSTLTINLEMGLRYIASSLTASFGILLAAAQGPLLASEFLLRNAIETRVLNRMPFTIGEEGLEPDINANIRMLAYAWKMLSMWLSLANNESIPMTISTMDEVNRLWSTFYRAMHLDLEGFPDLRRDMQVFAVSIKPHIAACAILPQLDRMPAIRLLETRKAHIRDAQLAGPKESFEGLGKSIRKHLHSRGWHMFTATAFELCGQIVLRGECSFLRILRFGDLKHLIIELARLDQALHQQAGLFLIWIQAVFKRSHILILID